MVGHLARAAPIGSRLGCAAALAALLFAAPSSGQIPRDDLLTVTAWREQAREAEVLADPPAPHRSIPQRFLIGSVHVYREVLSSQDASRCPFSSSCSHFGEDAITQAGFLKGILLASDRLQRCHPFASRYYLQTPETQKLDDPIGAHLGRRSETAADGAGADPALHPRANPAVAMMLSAVVPGSGKVYAGRTWDGISSALAVGIPVGFAWNGFHDDGVGSARGWTLGTIALVSYASNIWGSGEAARDRRTVAGARSPVPPRRRPIIGTPDPAVWAGAAAGDSADASASFAPAYDVALRAYADERYAESTARFLDIADAGADSSVASRARFFQSLSHAEQYQWRAAERAGDLFLRTGAGADSATVRTGLELLGDTARRKGLSPGRAKLLSAFLPGAGQLYARRPRKAFFAAVVTGAFGYYAYRVADRGAEGELLLIALPAFFRYYRGNILSAGDCAVEANRRRNREAVERFNATLGVGE